MESKLKHLEFIQSVINRLATNSFLFKGWAITLAAGLSAFAASASQGSIAALAAVSTIGFWLIDGFYLSLERCYRELYDEVAAKTEAEIDFSMRLSKPVDAQRWLSALLSPTLLVFYGLIVLIDLLGVLAIGSGDG